MTICIDRANKDVFSAGLGETILLLSQSSLEMKLLFKRLFRLAI